MNRNIIVVLLAMSVCCCTDDKIAISNPNSVDSTYLLLSEMYYWNHVIPVKKSIPSSSMNSPVELVEFIRRLSPVNPKLSLPADRWSFAVKNESWTASLKGDSRDFGMGLRFLSSDDLRISWVQPKSSAGHALLKRGMKVVKLNNINPSYDKIDVLRETISKEEVITIALQGIDSEVKLTKSNYQVSPVIKYDVFTFKEKKIGYIHLITFIESANEQFTTIFKKFQDEKVDQLIVDLRYNGGGLLSVMESLAGYIVPERIANKILYKLKYNQKYKDFEEKVFFQVNPNTLSLNSVKFIIGPATASASEILIHSLAPHIKVVTLGLPSHGKLLGMQPTKVGAYTIAPISFMVLNAVESAREAYFTIEPNYLSTDDLLRDFSMEEGTISIALEENVNGRLGTYAEKSLIADKENNIGLNYIKECIK